MRPTNQPDASPAKAGFPGRRLDSQSPFRIVKNVDETLTFEGERIVRVCTGPGVDDSNGPSYETSVYKTVTGTYVVRLVFDFHVPLEQHHEDVENVDTFQELDDFLCLQDPESILDQDSLAELRDPARKTLVESINRQFFRHVTEVLESVKEWECGHPAEQV